MQCNAIQCNALHIAVRVGTVQLSAKSSGVGRAHPLCSTHSSNATSLGFASDASSSISIGRALPISEGAVMSCGRVSAAQALASLLGRSALRAASRGTDGNEQKIKKKPARRNVNAMSARRDAGECAGQMRQHVGSVRATVCPCHTGEQQRSAQHGDDVRRVLVGKRDALLLHQLAELHA